MKPQLFVLSTMTNYLFQNDFQQILKFGVPPQFGSVEEQARMASLATSTAQVGNSVIAVTLLLQIIAKKIISYIWVFYSALQIMLIVNMKSNLPMPASVTVIVSAIDGIVNLSSLDKKAAAEMLNLQGVLSQDGSSLLDNLGGIALAMIGIVLLLLFLVVARCLCSHPRVKKQLFRLKNFLFWNFLIRYFQASFININFAALNVISNKNIGWQKISTSALIVGLQYGLVVFVFYTLLAKPLYYYSNLNTRLKIGNLYSQLDTSKRQNLLFAMMYFIQRCFIVLIVVSGLDGGLQWTLIQCVLMANSLYLFAVAPYESLLDSLPDYINTVVLLIFQSIQASLLSLWVNNSKQRYKNGLFFDGFLGLSLVVNFGYVILASSRPAILKLKRAYFRYKQPTPVFKVKQPEWAKTEQNIELASAVPAHPKESLWNIYNAMIDVKESHEQELMKTLKSNLQVKLNTHQQAKSNELELVDIENDSELVASAQVKQPRINKNDQKSDYHSSNGQLPSKRKDFQKPIAQQQKGSTMVQNKNTATALSNQKATQKLSSTEQQLSRVLGESSARYAGPQRDSEHELNGPQKKMGNKSIARKTQQNRPTSFQAPKFSAQDQLDRLMKGQSNTKIDTTLPIKTKNNNQGETQAPKHQNEMVFKPSLVNAKVVELQSNQRINLVHTKIAEMQPSVYLREAEARLVEAYKRTFPTPPPIPADMSPALFRKLLLETQNVIMEQQQDDNYIAQFRI